MFRWLAKGENCSLIAHAQIFLLAFDYRPHPPYGKHATKRLTPLCAYQCQAPTPLPPQYGRRRALGRDLNFKTCPRVGNLIKRFKIITDHVARDKTTVPRGSVLCGVCEGVYEDVTDEMENWVGCENRPQWFHFGYAGIITACP